MAYQRSQAYKPGQKEPYRISRSKIELFTQCPRCFWLDARLKIKRPSSPPFRINSAIDELLKKEFDIHRAAQTKHPLSEAYGLDLVPFQHAKMEEWRDAMRRGIQYLHPKTNLNITGGIDDVWEDPSTGELVIADYKATSKNGEVSIDADWQIAYKRQIEVYQWLFRANDFKVSDMAYFVYCNGKQDSPSFDGKLEFDIKLIPYEGDDSWVEPAIVNLKKCLEGDMPAVGTAAMGGECEHCAYARTRTELTLDALKKKK
ncbi:MAG: PD-(D/E)XK nuclease family protein [bacterium]|nr:PD-(D/E)XK nuclease family protein [bacterium]